MTQFSHSLRTRFIAPLLAVLPLLAACEAADRIAAPDPTSATRLAPTELLTANLLAGDTDLAAEMWIPASTLGELSTSGTAWSGMKKMADTRCEVPDLTDQDDKANTCVLAKALAFARTGTTSYRADVVGALRTIVAGGTYRGRALALGRELAAYVLAADLVGLRSYDAALDDQFRRKLQELRTTYTSDGPKNLIECHELRPNNWGTMCGASRIAVAVYLGDRPDLERAATVFRGYLGDRGAYAGFKYGDLAWQCDPARPVGINPRGCTKDGHSLDGVLPEEQRRGGGFTWPAPQESYVYEGLQGALTQAMLLSRQGYDVWNWSDRALLRAFTWLHTQNDYPADGDDTWQPHVINRVYGTSFPAPLPARAGKIIGWTDWTFSR